MNMTFYWMVTLSYLWAADPRSPLRSCGDPETGYAFRGRVFLKETSEFLGQIFFFGILWAACLWFWPAIPAGRLLLFPLLFPAVFAVNSVRKKSDIFALTVAGSGLYLFPSCGDFSGLHLLETVHVLTGIIVFRFLLIHIRERMLFCAVPGVMKGLPADLLAASLLALALWGFQGIIP